MNSELALIFSIFLLFHALSARAATTSTSAVTAAAPIVREIVATPLIFGNYIPSVVSDLWCKPSVLYALSSSHTYHYKLTFRR